MIDKSRSPVDRIKILFREGLDNMETVRGEISTCILCDNTLFLAYDESSAVERLTWKDGKYKKHKTFELDDFFDLPDGKEGEMDIEGLAWEEPFLWVTGSMSLKRNTPSPDDNDEEGAAKLAEIGLDRNRFSLGKIPCAYNEEKGTWKPVKELTHNGETLKPLMLEGGNESTVLTEMLSNDPHLANFMDIPCKDNGFDIEGLAVYNSRVFIGLRGPVLGGWAIVVEFRLHERNGWLHMEGRGDKDKPYNKHFINIAGMGIREININSKNGDAYILAGPTMDLDGTIGAWRVQGGFKDKEVTTTHNPERLFDVVNPSGTEHGKNKAEGMAITRNGNYLVVYDSPSKDRMIKKRGVYADVFKEVKKD